MSHKPTQCPYCKGDLENRGHGVMHEGPSPNMYRCAECRRWFLHRQQGTQCGLIGWMTAHPTREKFVECSQQIELAI